jgi:mannose-6-phosphate isomerase-like protein (cupin superfamily)
MDGKFFDISKLAIEREQRGRPYFEFLRIAALSAGVYVLPASSTDPQKPHKQDELYYVVSGRARMKVAAEDREVRTGSVIFVAADVEHRFYEIREELVVLVFFAPAESN